MVILIIMPNYIQPQYPQNGVASPRTASQPTACTAYCGTAAHPLYKFHLIPFSAHWAENGISLYGV